jgi:hypothetical protein
MRRSLALRSRYGRARTAWWWRLHQPHPRDEQTARYIAALDLDRMRELGSDYFNPRYGPERMSKPEQEIDQARDYDFGLVDETFDRLRDVDRHAVLAHVFATVTAGAAEPTEVHLALLRFLQQAAHHNAWVQPMHRDAEAVCDPLVLLELNEMRCGAVSRLAVDLLASGGYPARLCQVGAHVIAEVGYEGGWHYLDADIFAGGETVFGEDGRIPSLVELAETPERLDRLAHYVEFNPQLTVLARIARSDQVASFTFPYPSSFYFGAAGYGDVRPVYYTKHATRDEERRSRLFGWEARHMRTDPNPGLTLGDQPIRLQPAPPRWAGVSVTPLGRGARVRLRWDPAVDGDDDVSGHRVHVGTRSRGWNFDRFTGAPDVEPFWNAESRWTAASYERLFSLPPADVALLHVDGAEAELDLQEPGRYFVSVHAVDRVGEHVGKELYFLSEELALTVG